MTNIYVENVPVQLIHNSERGYCIAYFSYDNANFQIPDYSTANFKRVVARIRKIIKQLDDPLGCLDVDLIHNIISSHGKRGVVLVSRI